MDGQIVQYAPGEGLDQVMGFGTGRVRLAHIRFPHVACVRTGQPARAIPFSLPLVSAETWTVNGVSGFERTLFLNQSLDETHVFAPNRNLIAGAVDRDLFLSTLARLGGQELDETELPRGPLYLTHEAHAAARCAFLDEIYDWASDTDVELVEEAVASTLAEAVLSVLRPNKVRTRADARSYAIFATAHAHLQSCGGRAVCIDDLCRITGVSGPTLTSAFRRVCGQTPMRYAARLRLAQAHRLLTRHDADIVCVKEAALRAGFTEMGRFSALYESAYGALPSGVLRSARQDGIALGQWLRASGDPVASNKTQPNC
ncbi:helix-turn-helix domain-containing protein [Shimia sp. SDUM112013]|uniref:AraC family transcriptional regulator n=1 Tax=Shimia sp. SDUM112013 TaxID=3136160 RepID=UPI0032F075FB